MGQSHPRGPSSLEDIFVNLHGPPLMSDTFSLIAVLPALQCVAAGVMMFQTTLGVHAA